MVTESSVMVEKVCWNRADCSMVGQVVEAQTRNGWSNIFLKGPHWRLTTSSCEILSLQVFRIPTFYHHLGTKCSKHEGHFAFKPSHWIFLKTRQRYLLLPSSDSTSWGSYWAESSVLYDLGVPHYREASPLWRHRQSATSPVTGVKVLCCGNRKVCGIQLH